MKALTRSERVILVGLLSREAESGAQNRARIERGYMRAVMALLAKLLAG